MYILNKTLKRPKLVDALCEFYGINYKISRQIIGKLGFSEFTLTKELKYSDILELIELLEEYLIESNLRQFNRECISDIVMNRSYRGFRHKKSLPVRGQRTHTNARTQKKLGKYRWHFKIRR